MIGQVGKDIRLAGLVLTPLLTWVAFPGAISFWPMLLVCLVPLFICLDSQKTARQAFVCGLLGGLFFYVLQIYWIVPVLVQYGGLPWLVAMPAMLLLVLYMSLYLALFSAGFFLLNETRHPILVALGAPSLWVGLDWLRSWLFSGFPWMDIGYGFWSEPYLLQLADLFGHFGYTFLIVLVNTWLSLLTVKRLNRRQCMTSGVAALTVLLVLAGYSVRRWQQVETELADAPAPVVGIVQGNVAQDLKWSESERQRIIENYIRLSRTLMADQSPVLITWPETALPFYPIKNELILPIVDFIQGEEVALLTGSPWYEIVLEGGLQQPHFYNSALLLTPPGRVSGHYFKTHLVPYGEYVPLQRYMPFLAPLVEAAGDFSRGRIEKPLVLADIRAGVLICFESIFGGMGRRWVDSGANLLVNLTNDAWYGKSSAPHQSWAMTVFRAAETRRSLVRSANTGISGVIDPLGRIVSESGLFTEWSAALPVPLLSGTTIFVRWGYLFAPFCGCLALFFLLLAVKKTQRPGRSDV